MEKIRSFFSGARNGATERAYFALNLDKGLLVPSQVDSGFTRGNHHSYAIDCFLRLAISLLLLITRFVVILQTESCACEKQEGSNDSNNGEEV